MFPLPYDGVLAAIGTDVGGWSSFRFQHPYWLALVPLIFFLCWRRNNRPRTRPAVIFSSVAEFKRIPKSFAQRIKPLMAWGGALALALLTMAQARPQLGKSSSKINTEGIAIMIALDVSGSMDAMDYKLPGGEAMTRTEAVKKVASDFVLGSKETKLPGRPNDLVGLVAFTSIADSKCPLTLDHGALGDVIKSLDTVRAQYDNRGQVLNKDEMGTAIGDGMALALDRLKNVEAKSKVLILLTDGDNNSGVTDPHDVADIAKGMGIKVYTIGVGTNGPAPIQSIDIFGNKRLGQMNAKIDEVLLQHIADTTGGKYFHAKNFERMTEIYSEIDRLEKTKVEENTFMEYIELYPWAAVPGLALLVFVALLSLTRFRTLP